MLFPDWSAGLMYTATQDKPLVLDKDAFCVAYIDGNAILQINGKNAFGMDYMSDKGRVTFYAQKGTTIAYNNNAYNARSVMVYPLISGSK